ncbi:MAG TPA: hypothetical protein VN038_17850 [Dyadobacter sp.]|nr:hypothetical protein [Dyadobacter sp.]
MCEHPEPEQLAASVTGAPQAGAAGEALVVIVKLQSVQGVTCEIATCVHA